MKKNKRLKFKKKRFFLLLEVLIAFTLVLLAAVPLIYPHISMIKAQKELINKINLNHSANLIYISILEKLYRNEIPLNEIHNSKIFLVEQEALKGVYGYKASYKFSEINTKPRNPDGLETYHKALQLNFIPNSGDKTISYNYELFIASQKEPEPVDPQAADEADDEEV